MMDADWDLLVLLDACHPEILESELDDEFDSSVAIGTRHSRGTDSSEFIRRQFAGKTLHDTVYVTGNPYLSEVPEGTFHATDNVLSDGFDKESGTVPPDIMVERTFEAMERYPHKRIISHFMQPHFPFLGEKGEKFSHGGIEIGTSANFDAPNPWLGVMYGMIEPQEAIAAYCENHRIVVPHIMKLVTDVSDRIIISADHANLLGQRTMPIPLQTYGHPKGIAHEDLTRVPWVEISATGQRRNIRENPPVGHREMNEELEGKLAALGYK